MAERFLNDDASYRRWRKAHGAGFVFNHFGGSDPTTNVLHRADCDLMSPHPAKKSTSVAKICATTRSDVESAADQACGGRDRWTCCDRCRP